MEYNYAVMDVTLRTPVRFSVVLPEKEIREYTKLQSGYTHKGFDKNATLFAISYCRDREVHYTI